LASGIYDGFKADLMEGRVDIGAAGDTIKTALMDGVHAFTAGDDTWADVSANEISGTGYVAGGETLSGQAVTEATTTKWDATDEAWGPGASFTANHAVMYDTTNADSLICSFDFGGAKTVSNGTFTIQWHINGIITLT
jgi:hypothetical protein